MVPAMDVTIPVKDAFTGMEPALTTSAATTYSISEDQEDAHRETPVPNTGQLPVPKI
jgi:hypothetical protein